MFDNIENITLALIALLVLITPLAYVKRRFDIFEPIYFFSAAFFVGGFLRGLCLLNDPSFRDTFSLSQGEVQRALIYCALGFLFFQLGYNNVFSRIVAKRCLVTLPDTWDHKRFVMAMIFVVTVGFIFLIYFVIQTGGLPGSIYELSYKRRVANNYICLGANFLSIGYILYLIHMYKTNSFNGLSYIKLFLLLISASLLPFLSSQRLAILTLVFFFYIYSNYFKKRFELKKLLILLVVATIFLLTMVEFRQAKRTKSFELSKALRFETATSFFVKSHYFFDIITSSLIVKHTPEAMEYQRGKTLLNWAVFPIPRSVWPDKPNNLGRRVRNEIFFEELGIRGGGITPPFMFELYLNFKIAGIVIGMFLFGLLSRAVYLNMADNSNMATMALHVLNMRFIYGLFIRDLTWNLVNYLQWAVPLFIILFFVTHGNNNVTRKIRN
jgi:oligosaccharide repeat unit polymerase